MQLLCVQQLYGSKKVAVDASELSGFSGVELIDNGDLVAVVHSDPEVSKSS